MREEPEEEPPLWPEDPYKMGILKCEMPFEPIPNALIDSCPRIANSRYTVVMRLCRLLWKEKSTSCRLTLESLAVQCRMSKETARKSIADLSEKKIISYEKLPDRQLKFRVKSFSRGLLNDAIRLENHRLEALRAKTSCGAG